MKQKATRAKYDILDQDILRFDISMTDSHRMQIPDAS